MRGKGLAKRPDCPFMHPDCFALMCGEKCWCLDDTHFREGQDCPFYKPENQVSHEIMMNKYREAAEG